HVIRAAQRHGVAPLVSSVLEDLRPNAVPPDAAERLADERRKTAWHSGILAEALCELAGELGGRGVDVMPLKGPVLAESLYGDPSLRPCRDLDVLVRAEQMPDAL